METSSSIDVEQLHSALTQAPAYSAKYAKIFGPATQFQAFDVLSNPLLIEIDCAIADDELSSEELLFSARVFPEFADVERGVDNLISQILRHFNASGRFKQVLDRTIQPGSLTALDEYEKHPQPSPVISETVTDFFPDLKRKEIPQELIEAAQKAEKLYQRVLAKQSQPIVKLLATLVEFFGKFKVEDAPMRNFFLLYAAERVMQYVMVQCIAYMLNHDYGKNELKLVREILVNFTEGYAQLSNLNLDIQQILLYIDTIRHVLRKKPLAQGVLDVFTLDEKLVHESEDSNVAAQVELVTELAEYRDVTFDRALGGKNVGVIEIYMPENAGENWKAQNICRVRLVFNVASSAEHPLAQFVPLRAGISTAPYELSPEIFELDFNRHLCELLIPNSSIHLRDVIPITGFYRTLKAKLLELLELHLFDQPETEFEQYLFRFDEAEQSFEKAVDDSTQLMREATRDIVGETGDEESEEVEVKTVLKKPRRRKYPKGVSGKRVLRVLTNILGEPRQPRGGSSHYMFTGLNGKPFPISIHHGKDVRYPLLKSCLRAWAVPFDVFFDQLG